MCKKVNKYTNLKNCEKYVEAFQNSKVPNGGVKQHIEQLNYQCIVLVNALVAINLLQSQQSTTINNSLPI